jgi:hypothetical protein
MDIIERRFKKDIEETWQLYIVMRERPDKFIPIHRNMQHYQETLLYLEKDYLHAIKRLKYLHSPHFNKKEVYKKLEEIMASNMTETHLDIVNRIFDEYIELSDKSRSSQSNHNNDNNHMTVVRRKRKREMTVVLRKQKRKRKRGREKLTNRVSNTLSF